MRILLVLEASLGGTSRHILDLASGLLERGEQVHLIYSPLRVDQSFLSRLAILCGERPDFHCQAVSITREVGASDLSSYRALSRYVREEGPFDVIHAHSTKAGFLARLLLNTQGARMVYTPHGLMTLDPQLPRLRRSAVCTLESILARRSDAVISVSIHENTCALETGIDPTKLFVIPNGIRPLSIASHAQRRASIRASLGLSPDTVCIGFVGRFFWYKKPERVLDAFALLKNKTTRPLRLVMLGWGPLEVELRRRVSELAINKDVLFLGQVDGPAYIPALDVLANSSLFEGMSYAFLEALSSGVPIVTTKVGGTDELISHGVTGYVCDPWDPNTFADHLQLLVDDPCRRSEMSGAARERAAWYSVTKMVDSIADLYGRLCARPDPAPLVPARYKTLPGNSK